MHTTPIGKDFFLTSFYPPALFFFLQNLSRLFPVSAEANIGSCVDPQKKIGHPSRRYTQLIQVPELGFRGIYVGIKTRVSAFMGWYFKIVSIILILREKLV